MRKELEVPEDQDRQEPEAEKENIKYLYEDRLTSMDAMAEAVDRARDEEMMGMDEEGNIIPLEKIKEEEEEPEDGESTPEESKQEPGEKPPLAQPVEEKQNLDALLDMLAKLSDEVESLKASQKPVEPEKPASPPPAPAPSVPVIDHEDVIDTVRSIMTDDDETAAQKLEALLQKTQMQKPLHEPDKIQRDVLAAVKNELYLRDLNERLYKSPKDGGYSDILSDPILKGLASEQVDRALNGGAQNTWDLYDSICSGIRKWVTSLRGPEPNLDAQKSHSDLEEKKARKAEVAEKVVAPKASQRRESDEKEERPMTPSEVVKEMKARRPGQNIW